MLDCNTFPNNSWANKSYSTYSEWHTAITQRTSTVHRRIQLMEGIQSENCKTHRKKFKKYKLSQAIHVLGCTKENSTLKYSCTLNEISGSIFIELCIKFIIAVRFVVLWRMAIFSVSKGIWLSYVQEILFEYHLKGRFCSVLDGASAI